MSEWHAMLNEQITSVDLVRRYSEVVSRDPMLTDKQAETLLAQVTKRRTALFIVIANMRRAEVDAIVIEPAVKLVDVWNELELAAANCLKMIHQLKNASPEGSG